MRALNRFVGCHLRTHKYADRLPKGHYTQRHRARFSKYTKLNAWWTCAFIEFEWYTYTLYMCTNDGKCILKLNWSIFLWSDMNSKQKSLRTHATKTIVSLFMKLVFSVRIFQLELIIASLSHRLSFNRHLFIATHCWQHCCCLCSIVIKLMRRRQTHRLNSIELNGKFN